MPGRARSTTLRPIETVGLNRLRIPLALGCLVAALWMASGWRDERRLHHAQDAVTDGRLVDAGRLASSVSGPMVDVEASRTRAIVKLRSGDLEGAQREIAAALGYAPNDWALRRDDAILLLRLGDRRASKAQMRRALALNPRMTLPQGFGIQNSG